MSYFRYDEDGEGRRRRRESGGGGGVEESGEKGRAVKRGEGRAISGIRKRNKDETCTFFSKLILHTFGNFLTNNYRIKDNFLEVYKQDRMMHKEFCSCCNEEDILPRG